MISKFIYETMILIRPNTIYNRRDPRTHKLFTGSDFNKQYQYARFVKVLDKTMTHYNFEYKEGLNVDTKMFNELPMLYNNGLYFFRIPIQKIIPDNLGHYMALYGDLVADVKIPDDANVLVEDSTAFKTDRLVLSNIRDLHSLLSSDLKLRLMRSNIR